MLRKKHLLNPWTECEVCPVHPALKWILLLGTLGTILGMGTFTFVFAKGHSYLTDNSEACINCHVMEPQFNAWMKSSHGSFTSCNSCHTPPGNLAKYMTKAQNGVAHAWAFSTGRFPENIRITDRNKEVTVKACIGCHGNVFAHPSSMEGAVEEHSCLSCHSDVGHPEGSMR